MTTTPVALFGGESVLRNLAVGARDHSTPAYVTDVATLAARARELETAFPDPWIRSYSLKANDLPALVARLWTRGWGANVVSLGEWRLAQAAGVPNSAISLEGIGKGDDELTATARAVRDGEPLRWVSLESADDAEALARICRDLLRGDPGPDVLLRLNPKVAPETSPGLAVGKPSSKFGMTHEELLKTAAEPFFADGTLNLRGIHVHIGSQLTGVCAWVSGAIAALDAYESVRALQPSGAIDTVDFGGGFAAGGESQGPPPGAFAESLSAAMRDAGHKLPDRVAVEPGRYLVAEAGWILASVLHVRERSGRQQVVLDAGMTELIRPALYGASHPVVPVSAHYGPAPRSTDVEGPVCESADSFGQHLLPQLRRGDRVAIALAGAYGSSQGSRYNGRGRPAELLIEPDGTIITCQEAQPVGLPAAR